MTIMTHQKLLFIFTTLLLLGACSNKELYNATQIQSKHDCNREVGVERDKCLQQLNKKSYEEYERERQEIIKPSSG